MQTWMSRVLDLIWPRRCEICSRAVGRPGRHVCGECLMRLQFAPQDGCAVCSREIASAGRELLCEECAGPASPHFDRAACAMHFDGFARQMVLDYKFNGHIWLRDDFVDFLEAAARSRFKVPDVDLVLPMPLTFVHRFDRGYDQCDMLARGLAARIDRAFCGTALRRTGNPRRQAGLSEEMRRENVKGTFRVARPELVAGRTLLVVDDVMTTGATFSECARALKAAGAWRVWVVALARSV